MRDLDKATLLERLRERRLLEWVIAYSGAAFLVIQLFDAVDGVWPNIVSVDVQRTAHVLLAFGFLATVTLAWFHGEKGKQQVTPLELVIIGGLCVIAALALEPTERIVGIPRQFAVPAAIAALLAIPVIPIVASRRRLNREPEAQPHEQSDSEPPVDDDRVRELWRRLIAAKDRETLEELEAEITFHRSRDPQSRGLRRLERKLREANAAYPDLSRDRLRLRRVGLARAVTLYSSLFFVVAASSVLILNKTRFWYSTSAPMIGAGPEPAPIIIVTGVDSLRGTADSTQVVPTHIVRFAPAGNLELVPVDSPRVAPTERPAIGFTHILRVGQAGSLDVVPVDSLRFAPTERPRVSFAHIVRQGPAGSREVVPPESLRFVPAESLGVVPADSSQVGPFERAPNAPNVVMEWAVILYVLGLGIVVVRTQRGGR